MGCGNISFVLRFVSGWILRTVSPLRKIIVTKSVVKIVCFLDELQKILCEVEPIINGRPLVYISECDLEDDSTPFPPYTWQRYTLK